jgi:N-formylmaleamate deformylase
MTQRTKKYRSRLAPAALATSGEPEQEDNNTYQYGANITANGIRQHYLRYGGKGSPLILVPGITSPAVTWGFVAERLGRVFDTYVLDVRGRGLSESTEGLDYGLNACAKDVVEFADALRLADYTVLGHSMGARIGIRAARMAGSRIKQLVLVDPPVTGPGRRTYPIGLDWLLGAIHSAAKGPSLEEMRGFFPKWTDEQIHLRAEWIPSCNLRAVEVAYRGFHEDDIHADLPHVRMPTLLVVAGKGVILPEEVTEIQRLLPQIQIKYVENAGHLIPWEDFSGFFAALTPFLAKQL